VSGTEEILAATRRWAEAFAAPMPGGQAALLALAAEDIHFTDPFNDLRGKAGLVAVLEDMAERCDDPRFTILDVAASEKAGYIRWEFRFTPKGGREVWNLTGMSEIRVGADGLILAHHDHWDSGAQLFSRLPVLGWLVRRVQAMLRVKSA